ncbi:MAG: FecR family protein [Pseudomonadota bacterium]
MTENGRHSAEQAAVEWFVRLRDEPVSEETRLAFESWYRADTVHAEAYREIERTWSGLDQLKGWRQVESGATEAEVADNKPANKICGRRFAIAASIAGLIGFGAYALAPIGLLADHRTGPGEQRTIVLDDGSRLHLNTTTALSVDLEPQERRITLHGGEMYIEVEPDSTRPFVVHAGGGRIDVLGTAFSVRRSAGPIEVIVTENQVEVSGPKGSSANVMAGQSIEFTDDALGSAKPTDAKNALAWRRGRLVFDGSPLAAVIRELDRYRRGRVMIIDSSVEDLKVTGSFAIDRTDEILANIEQALPVRLYHLSDFLVLIFARSEA